MQGFNAHFYDISGDGNHRGTIVICKWKEIFLFPIQQIFHAAGIPAARPKEMPRRHRLGSQGTRLPAPQKRANAHRRNRLGSQGTRLLKFDRTEA